MPLLEPSSRLASPHLLSNPPVAWPRFETLPRLASILPLALPRLSSHRVRAHLASRRLETSPRSLGSICLEPTPRLAKRQHLASSGTLASSGALASSSLASSRHAPSPHFASPRDLTSPPLEPFTLLASGPRVTTCLLVPLPLLATSHRLAHIPCLTSSPRLDPRPTLPRALASHRLVTACLEPTPQHTQPRLASRSRHASPRALVSPRHASSPPLSI